jgi:hypothetical protein
MQRVKPTERRNPKKSQPAYTKPNPSQSASVGGKSDSVSVTIDKLCTGDPLIVGKGRARGKKDRLHHTIVAHTPWSRFPPAALFGTRHGPGVQCSVNIGVATKQEFAPSAGCTICWLPPIRSPNPRTWYGTRTDQPSRPASFSRRQKKDSVKALKISSGILVLYHSGTWTWTRDSGLASTHPQGHAGNDVPFFSPKPSCWDFL